MPCSSSPTEIANILISAAWQAEIVGWCPDIRESTELAQKFVWFFYVPSCQKTQMNFWANSLDFRVCSTMNTWNHAQTSISVGFWYFIAFFCWMLRDSRLSLQILNYSLSPKNCKEPKVFYLWSLNYHVLNYCLVVFRTTLFSHSLH